MIDSQLDCIVRFHNSRRLCELKRCFFSLYGRYHRPLNVIVVTQRFTGEEIDVLEREIGELPTPISSPSDREVRRGHLFSRRNTNCRHKNLALTGRFANKHLTKS